MPDEGSKRKPRLPSNERVIIEGDESTEAWTVNWSREGMCILTERNLEVGEGLRLDLPERHAKALVRVIWVQVHRDGCLAGVEFVSLDRRPT
jgi:hypothetical protein